MSMRDLIPWGQPNHRVPFAGNARGGSLLRQELNRMMSELFAPRSSDWPGLTGWPNVEVKESADEVRVTAELPGLSEKDIDLSVHEGMLTLKGERRSDREDRDRGWSERYYGSFERVIALPDGADEAQIQANFNDGVLTVRMPKSEAKRRGRKIAINAETRH